MANEKKTGFTINKADGSSVTVYADCFCITCLEENFSGSNYSVIHGSKADVIGLVELMELFQRRLLKQVADDLHWTPEKLESMFAALNSLEVE